MTTLRQALEDNKRLRGELEHVKQQLNDLTRQSIDEALSLIDQLDEDNRLLRGRVRVLEQRRVSGRLRSQRAGLLNLGRDQVWGWYRRASKTLVSIFFRCANRN